MAKSDRTDRSTEIQEISDSEQNSPSIAEPEVLSKASEALRPYLRDAGEAETAALQVVSVIRLHRGPLPPPELLGGYDRILPGAAREIMDMALREQLHRHSMEHAESRYPFWGMACGLFAFVLCVSGAIYLAQINQPIIAGLLVGTPLIGAIGWFINGRLQVKRALPPSSSRERGSDG